MYKKLLTDSAMYGLGAILIKSLAFFTLPIYTRIFTPEEFGIIEIFSTISGILAILMSMGLDTAQSYYFMEAKNKKDGNVKEITTAILQLRILISAFFVIISVASASVLIEFIFDAVLPYYYLWIVAFSTFFGTLVSQSLEIFRLLYKPWKYIGLSFIQAICGIAFTLLFAYYYNGGIGGYLFGIACGSFLAMLTGWVATKDYRYWNKIESRFFKEFLKFGLPLVPAGLLVWVMQASDRLLIVKLLSEHEVGVYALGAKLSLLITLALQIFAKAVNPLLMDLLHQTHGNIQIAKIAHFYTTVGALGVVILAFSSQVFVGLIAPNLYAESWIVVGALSMSAYFYGFTYFTWLGTFKVKKTHLNNIALASAVIINLLLNFILIPLMGILGAALASAIALFISNIFMYFISNRYYYIPYNFTLITAVIFTMCILYYISLEVQI